LTTFTVFILLLANPGPPGKMAVRMEREYKEHKNIDKGSEKCGQHTPGSAHSPESLRLTETNWSMGLSEARWITLRPASSLFQLTISDSSRRPTIHTSVHGYVYGNLKTMRSRIGALVAMWQ